jgi:NAD/NADP transhydrogenase beta subunit
MAGGAAVGALTAKRAAVTDLPQMVAVCRDGAGDNHCYSNAQVSKFESVEPYFPIWQ